MSCSSTIIPGAHTDTGYTIQILFRDRDQNVVDMSGHTYQATLHQTIGGAAIETLSVTTSGTSNEYVDCSRTEGHGVAAGDYYFYLKRVSSDDQWIASGILTIAAEGGVSKFVLTGNFSDSGQAVVVAVRPSALGLRTPLTANTTFYVRTDGSDSNDGSADSSGSAWLTLQHAVDMVSGSYDLGAYTATIKVGGSGVRTFTEALSLPTLGAGAVVIEGDTTTPANCVLSNASGSHLSCYGGPNQYTLKGFKLTGAGRGLECDEGGKLIIDDIEFANTGAHYMRCRRQGMINGAGGSFTLASSVARGIRGKGGCTLDFTSATFTLTGTPVYSTCFVELTEGSNARFDGSTIASGSATGTRDVVEGNSALFLSGFVLPGNADGTPDHGGVTY